MPYQVSIDGVGVFTTDDLTLAEAVAVEAETGHSWYEFNPFRSAQDCQALMVAFLRRTLSEDVARKQVEAMTLKEAIASLDIVDDDRPTVYEDGAPDLGVGGESATTG